MNFDDTARYKGETRFVSICIRCKKVQIAIGTRLCGKCRKALNAELRRRKYRKSK